MNTSFTNSTFVQMELYQKRTNYHPFNVTKFLCLLSNISYQRILCGFMHELGRHAVFFWLKSVYLT